MRQVRTCDFCGGDAAGLYEPYPDSVPDGPRLLLCEGCRERLSSVVDPLLAEIEGGADGSEPRRTPGAGLGVSTPGADAGGPDRPADATASGGSDAGGRPIRERGGTPPGYRKVMRFLENRELPVDRAEAEQLAGEAYELDEAAVAEAIDHAVQYGRLREVDGELKR